MGVFTGTFSSAALLILIVCLPVAKMPAFIPRTSSAIWQIVASSSLLTVEFG